MSESEFNGAGEFNLADEFQAYFDPKLPFRGGRWTAAEEAAKEALRATEPLARTPDEKAVWSEATFSRTSRLAREFFYQKISY